MHRAALAMHVAQVLAAAGVAAEVASPSTGDAANPPVAGSASTSLSPEAGTRAAVGHLHARGWPSVPVHALPDAVAVCANDLAAALARLPSGAVVDGIPGAPSAEQLAASMLAEVLLHRCDLDGAEPGPQASAVALAVLSPSHGVDPDQVHDIAPRRAVLALAATRCPVTRD